MTSFAFGHLTLVIRQTCQSDDRTSVRWSSSISCCMNGFLLAVVRRTLTTSRTPLMASQIWPWISSKNTDYKSIPQRASATKIQGGSQCLSTLFSGHGSKPSHGSLVWMNISFCFFLATFPLKGIEQHCPSLAFFESTSLYPLAKHVDYQPSLLAVRQLPRAATSSRAWPCYHLVHHRFHHQHSTCWIMTYI